MHGFFGIHCHCRWLFRHHTLRQVWKPSPINVSWRPERAALLTMSAPTKKQHERCGKPFFTANDGRYHGTMASSRSNQIDKVHVGRERISPLSIADRNIGEPWDRWHGMRQHEHSSLLLRSASAVVSLQLVQPRPRRSQSIVIANLSCVFQFRTITPMVVTLLSLSAVDSHGVLDRSHLHRHHGSCSCGLLPYLSCLWVLPISHAGQAWGFREI
jgi:hypothetical protein